MTKKDYILTAAAIKRTANGIEACRHLLTAEELANQKRGVAGVARALGRDLQAQNPRFDYTLFINACGV